MRTLAILGFIAGLATSACSPSTACVKNSDCTSGRCDRTAGVCLLTEDAGENDSGSPTDAGPSGSADGGSADAGVVDAGSADAGTADAGPVDSGSIDAGLPDAGPADAGPGLLANGSTCAAASQCQSNFCVDGFCCNSVCGCGTCNSTGSQGTCVPVAANTDPRHACGAYTCDGAGNCQTSCSSGACSATCSSGNYCDASGQCVPKLATGTACLGSDCECSSGYCLDGYCCGGACPGPCVACDVPGSLGTCTDALANTDPRNQCGDYTCNGSGACQASCSGGACSATCKSPDYCNASGQCVPRLANGSACSGACQCSSGFCTNGYCCNSACSTPCNACNLSGSLGSCTPVLPGTDPKNQCGSYWCSGTGACLTSCSGVQCGAGSNCKPGDYCAGNACIAQVADGQTCSTACGCLSGTCNTYYRDADGDGYGNAAAAVTVCGANPPSGYVTNSADCCDSDSRANPGVPSTSWFTSANNCGTFDYNCDGAATKEYPNVATNCTNPTGTTCTVQQLDCLPGSAGWGSTVPPCGASGNWAQGDCQTFGCCANTCGGCCAADCLALNAHYDGGIQTQACH